MVKGLMSKKIIWSVCISAIAVFAMTSKSYATEVKRIEYHNIVKEMRVEDTGETLNASDVKTGAGQYMTQSEIKAFTEEAFKAAWDKAEAENKRAWDKAEAERQSADSKYVPREYVGEEYSPLDFNGEIIRAAGIDNIEGIKAINFNNDSKYTYNEELVIVSRNTYVTVTYQIVKVIRTDNQSNAGSTGTEQKKDNNANVAEETNESIADVYSAFVNELDSKVRTSKATDTIKINLGAWHSIPSYMMEKIISCGRDVELTYMYKGKTYIVTIKNGKGVNLNLQWYGPILMNGLYGNN